jgi:hypothetical protein
MGLNLESALNPLLTKLSQSAKTAYKAQVSAASDVDRPGWETLIRDIGPATEPTDKFEKDFRQLVEPELETLLARFREYYTLDGYNVDPLVELFAEPGDRWETPTGGSVYCHIAQASDGVDNVAQLVHSDLWESDDSDQWKGQAAMAFRDKFLNPFKATAAVHGACAREMATAAKALVEGVELAKESVVWICKKAIFELGGDESPGEHPGEGAEGEHGFKKKAAFAAILADAVAFFRAVVAPETLLVDIGLSATGLAGGLIAESHGPSRDEPIDFHADRAPGGGTVIVQSTLVNVHSALNALDRNISGLDERINRGLERDLSPSDLFEHPQAHIDNPDLKPSAYKTVKGSVDHTHDVDGVVINVVRLYYAGYVTLPVAASMYEHGVQVCTGAHITDVQRQFPRSVAKFNEAAEAFRGLLSSAQEELTNSGQAMVTAAKNYEYADAYDAQQIREFTAQIPDPNSIHGQDSYTRPTWLK